MEIENQVVEDDMVEIIETKKDKWPPHIESHFIALMVEEVKKGNRQTTTLTKPAWKRIKEELKTKFGKEYKKEQFKNKFNGLRGKWKVFHNLIKMETGLRYNASTGQIIASDDEWKKLIEKYKLGKQFRKKGCPHYEKLSIIFGDTTASSANQHPSTKRSSISDDDSERENDFDHEEHSYQTKKKANVGSNSKEGETSRDDVQLVFVEASKNMGESFKRKADVLEKLNTSHFEETNNKLMTCLSILEKLKGIGAAPFTKAVKMLKEDPLWRDVFLALSDERKRDLVLNL